ncbi:mechanosensitive ion channel family protein [Mesobacillus maritimus]|uniref:mechanosensitive ion channel family protein n=1 Tax=Mesobacillus maritimus TaxID=1643336 RepID=UPI00203BD419|nr:mechanosensitive ion channel family protein [Mesobacillus maritimus]MCM3588715.1 mechanosensitive ion channel family protein [Mesobacillus maritimus]
MFGNLWFSSEVVENIAISLGIFLLFMIFRKIFSKYVFKLLLWVVKKAPSPFFSQIMLAFEKPLQWVFLIIGIFVSAEYFPYFNEHNPFFLSLIRASLIFLISWGLINLASGSSVFFRSLNKKYSMEIDEILIPFLSKALKVVIVAISFTIIAQEFGYDISGFVAGLGIGGLAISLAAKDALGNLVGGVVIITERPFSIGDWIMTPSVEGTVEDITFRSTSVRTFAQALVTVPNSTLANENITNWSKMGKRQISFQLRIAYNTPREKLEGIVKQIRNILNQHDEVHPETIFATFDKYSDNGYEIFLYFFTKTTVWAEFLRIKEEINFEILKIIENEGVEIAIPARKLYPDVEMEQLTSRKLLKGEN